MIELLGDHSSACQKGELVTYQEAMLKELQHG